jgi:hypothetical protein
MFFPPLALVAQALGAIAFNFQYEAVQLVDSRSHNPRNIGPPGYVRNEEAAKARCKVFPGSVGWPITAEWDRLNASLGGALLKPIPAAAVCYDGIYRNDSQCSFLLGGASRTRFYSDDPLTVLNQWPQGNTCPATANATGSCTQGGFPSFVVNATTVRDIQVAVNFAREKSIRLVVK